MPVVLFTGEIMDAYTPVTMVNLPHVSFIGVPTKKAITGNK